MKILFLTEFFPTEKDGAISGGAESRTYYLAKELAKAGSEITIMTAYLPGTKSSENWNGVKIIRVGRQYDYIQSGSNLKRLSYALSAVWAGIRGDYEVVDANNTACYMAASAIAKFGNKKCVFWVPDILGLTLWLKVLGKASGLINYINETCSLLTTANRYIALSETTRGKLAKFPFTSRRTKVIYPGICNGKRYPKVSKTILSVHRLVNYKRTDLVIRALKILSKNGLKLKYRIIGDGPERGRLESLVKRLGVQEQVYFLGNLPHAAVLQEMAKSWLFCLPSDIEGFGIVTLEAAAFGTPFVNSDIPVHKEIASISGAGLLFKHGDPVSLAKIIRELLGDSVNYRRLSKKAIRFAKNYSQERVAKETLRVYENLLSH